MRRAVIGLLLRGCAAAGVGAAVLLAAAQPAASFATGTTVSGTTTTTRTTGTTTTGTTTTGTTTTGTTTTTTTSATPTTPPRPAVIAPGVTIGGVAVGDLPPDAAYTVVKTAFQAPLTIRFRNRSLSPTPRSLGATAYVRTAVNRARSARPGTDVRLFVRVRGARVRAYVRKLSKRFDRPAVDSRLVLRGLRPFLTKDRDGLAVDRAAATRAIVRALTANDRRQIMLPARPARPLVTRRSYGSIIVIRRGSNRLFLYDGMRLRRSFGVATGSAQYPTPLGRFSIVVKWANPWWYPPDSDWARGKEPVPPGPGNPLGTRWMGISSPGVGIHGTPDPGSIGYSLSHGCIRMLIPDAEWLFGHVDIGTPVFIVAA